MGCAGEEGRLEGVHLLSEFGFRENGGDAVFCLIPGKICSSVN